MKKSKADPESALTFNQQLFAEEYVRNGGNGAGAYCTVWGRSNRDSAATQASKLLRNSKVIDAIASYQEVLKRAFNFSREEYLKHLFAVATANPHHIKHKVREGLVLNELEGLAIDCKAGDRKAALDDLAKILGFNGKSDQESFDDLDSGMASTVDGIQKRGKKS